MASSFALMFDEILRRELTAVLSRVAEGENLNLDNLVSKYLPADLAPAKATKTKAPKKKREAKVSVNPEPKPEATKCTSVTAKGKPCSLKALAGECMCRVHLKAAEKAEAPTAESAPAPRGPATGPVKKPKKAKKTEQPKHTHDVDEDTHEDCELCQTHGSAMADTDDEEEFETVLSPPRTLRERLARVATQAYEDDDEEE